MVRVESYEKDFKPIVIGRIELPKGDGVISLTAPEIPGDQALEFRLLTLRPVDS